ncbi:MAG: hypothetical protein HUJ58_03035, partial [Erysipelotrichaceae bacterium]|nr:hypothetical protein [Erysipelotrichaceae bacterium]
LMHIVNTILRKTVCSYANYFYTYDTVGVKALEWLREKFRYPLVYLFPVVLILIPYMYVITLIHNVFAN